MFIRGYEWGILHNLIGKKAQAVILPDWDDNENSNQAVLVLSDEQGIVIDSCFREHAPTETIGDYPQLRVRVIDSIPDEIKQREKKIDLNEYGEIIRTVKIVNEEVDSPSDIARYTKAIHIEFSGDRDVTITRETFRSPQLHVFEKGDWEGEVINKRDPYASRQILSF
ncbi:hypothetical protein [Ileibacterium valens]|uniref:Uncharacterized protein n=1 Tax=Ileibacterium valens TaxID=1862668 RepID=A0A1U7NCV4_9FIRM|nr:hypothetical protein [Ileibacterium valens]OLU36481.1 hypothetical protein BO224_12330 [Erysipelotrichaceae bacterium NYU-BL-E8]OLU36574.1 hypothetical protein BO222_12155 [Ileibacterium valens]OLU43447.1 hypothetical protein BM735_00350 [Erysipelotrichaceae bacterium NYU-BL-F16]